MRIQEGKIWVYPEPFDMRGGLHRLKETVERSGIYVRDGGIFLFVSRDCHTCKIVWWDGTGFVVYFKRLCKGHFNAPWKHKDSIHKMTRAELELYLQGSKLAGKVSLTPEPITF
jgi:transposase